MVPQNREVTWPSGFLLLRQAVCIQRAEGSRLTSAFIEHVSGTVPGHQETKANKKGAESAGADTGECTQAGPQVCVPGWSQWAERAGGRRVGSVAKSQKGNWCLPESQGLSSRGGSVSRSTWCDSAGHVWGGGRQSGGVRGKRRTRGAVPQARAEA